MTTSVADKTGSDVRSGKAHVRPARRAQRRFSRAASAKETIAGFGHGVDVVGLTYGQFSLIDLIQATLDYTGPADVVISTWSAGFYDVEAANNFARDGRIRDIRFVMDSGRQKKGQAGVYDIAQFFGDDSIITMRTHAKFVLIGNADWRVVITSSMNLNKNIRCEQFEMTDDAGRYEFFRDFVDAAFREAGAERTFGRKMPPLSTVPESMVVQPMAGVSRAVKSITLGPFDE